MSDRMLTVWITGANGQLGKELAHMDLAGIELVATDRSNLDITDLAQGRELAEARSPDVIIHCAAYTAVDKAETDQDEAYRINALGTRNMAMIAEEANAKLCYISTDYVFDGMSELPYSEYDRPNPRTVYGKTKLAGEQFVQSLCSRYFIVRTSWVYGPYGQNFVKTMLRLAEEKDRLSVVRDQVGSPTYTYDLAMFLYRLIQTERYGIYHASNTGICSWYEFAMAIFEEAGKAVEVVPCTTADFPRPAPRPANSAMEHRAIRMEGLPLPRPWRDALRAFLQRI